MTNQHSSVKLVIWGFSELKSLLRLVGRMKAAGKPGKRILFRGLSGSDPLIVMERAGIRYLVIGKSTQSAWQPSDPDRIVHFYPRLMLAAFAGWHGHRDRRNGRVLVIGLGAGILPRHLARTYPHLNQISLELDPLVYDVAVRFFDFPGWLPVRIADGMDFLTHNEEKYDAIFLDVFDGTYVPGAFLSEDFLRLCSRRLEARGMVIANLYEGSATKEKESLVWKNVFPGALEIRNPERLRGNRIIVAGQSTADVEKFRRDAVEILVQQGMSRAEGNRLLLRTTPLQLD